MATARSKYDGWNARGLDELDRTVAEYLADEARHGGIFVKSKRIAADLGDDLSAHRVGQALAKLDEEWSALSIDRWSGDSANAATWHVEHDGPSPFGVECSDCGTLVDDVGDDCPSCGTEVDR